MSGNTVVTLAPGLGTLERFGISLLNFINFYFFILILLSDKLADEIDLDLFNDIPLFGSLLIDLYFFTLRCL